MNFFSTFRGRLLVVLAFLLILTLGVQFYLNLKNQNENNRRRELQERTLVAGIALGVSGITSSEEYLQDLIEQPDRTFLDAESRERIQDIIIVNEKWQVTDSLNPDYVPRLNPDGTLTHKALSDLTDLPPVMEGARLGDDLANFPNRTSEPGVPGDAEAHAIPIETSQGRWYVLVVLRNDSREAAWRAAQPLIYTFGIFLVSTLITFVLVWRFSRPITALSNAAKRIAEGDLGFRILNSRTDEVGRLTQRFNEMTAELEKSKELEEQLQQAEKSAVIGRLGSAIAHEIRNPLNYINLTLDHLRSKYAPAGAEEEQHFKKLIGQIKEEVARINQQISDFLNYSRPATLNARPINVRDAIEDSLRIVEGLAAESNVKTAVVERENVPRIIGDPEHLRSVFNNLFINAVQSMGNEGGNLSVKIAPDDASSAVRIEVADTGSGIPEDNLKKIFEPYFSTKETGTGLGLAIVQKVIEVHNGSIEAVSTIGEGTTFIIKLPSEQGGTEV
jgi:signal transduction histidine kinase